MLFNLQALLWVGLYIVFNPNMATSLPIEFVNKDSINTIKYPIHVACECKQYELYVDGKFIEQAGAVEGYLESDWVHLGEPTLRRTIKKFLDGITL